jgi:hypothetical protein
MSRAVAGTPHRLKSVALMITAKKNAPSLAAWGKSTFSEGGGDKRCMQKSTLVRNCTGFLLQCSKFGVSKCKKLTSMPAKCFFGCLSGNCSGGQQDGMGRDVAAVAAVAG